MNRQFKAILSASAASALAMTVSAQQPMSSTMGQTNSVIRLNGPLKTSDALGATVKNYQDEKLGSVSDVVLDLESGRILEVILARGGFLGMAKTLTAVPSDVLHHEAGQKAFQLDASPEKFYEAPKFIALNQDTDMQSNEVSAAYGYYGERPYFAHPDGARSLGKVNNMEIARSEANTNTTSAQNPAGIWTRNDPANANGMNSSWSKLGYQQPASKLMGTTVWNLKNEKLGKVKNIILDLQAGRIVAVIISSGGYMGMDGDLSAIPAAALHYNGEHNGLQLDATKESLASAPHFNSYEWPDFSQTDYAAGIYKSYNVQPYLGTNMAVAAKNRGQNVHDRDDRTLSLLDQGHGQRDVDITAQIRQEIIATEGISLNAKNVKIITDNGRVTLRGPVNTAEEKQFIGQIADRVAQSENVDNQLAVASN